ncbi:MAG: DNA alkylation repair protein [Nanoarchaeota archaeon]
MLLELRKTLKASHDPTYHPEQFFKEPIKVYNIRYPVVRKIARDYFPKQLKHPDLILQCMELWKSGMFEECVVAMEWAERAKMKEFDVFESWLKNYATNWAHVDGLCGSLIGPLLEEHPELIPRVKAWHMSKNRWVRRASAVAFVVPGRHGKYLADIFDISIKLMKDEDDLVQKAYGWALKEACHHHEKEVFQFVMKHKKIMPRTALRYAIEKMPKELKSRAMEK